jgi:hypothetical protein
VGAHRGDEVVVDGHGYVVLKEGRLAGAGVVARPGVEDVGPHGGGERGGERVLVRVKLGVELVEGLLADLAVAFDHEGAVGRLGQFALQPVLVRHLAKLHIHVGQLGKGFPVGAHGTAAQSEEPFLRGGEGVRFAAAQAQERGTPFGKFGGVQKPGEGGVVDGLDLGPEEGTGLADAGHEVVKLRLAGQRLRVGTVLGTAQGGVLAEAFNLEVE